MAILCAGGITHPVWNSPCPKCGSAGGPCPYDKEEPEPDAFALGGWVCCGLGPVCDACPLLQLELELEPVPDGEWRNELKPAFPETFEEATAVMRAIQQGITRQRAVEAYRALQLAKRKLPDGR